MKILILGAAGYLGQATVAYLRERGHEVTGVDSNVKDQWMTECAVEPLIRPDGPAYERRKAQAVWHSTYAEVDAVVHYAEQASAPYSMRGAFEAFETVNNNTQTTLDMILKVREANSDCHIVKLGTMGVYGTPGIPIREGWYDYPGGNMKKGERVRLPFPKQPGSLYHCTKAMDSDMLEFAARVWDLRVTDLHQGVVYGNQTDEMEETTFYYDHIFGTCLNRFITQAVTGMPLTVYGRGGQTRGWLNILDTLRCVELALESPPDHGTYRVLNQFTETFSVLEMAQRVVDVSGAMIEHIENPRRESEDHYYHASNEGFRQLGLEPHVLTDDVLAQMIETVTRYRDRIDPACIMPAVKW